MGVRSRASRTGLAVLTIAVLVGAVLTARPVRADEGHGHGGGDHGGGAPSADGILPPGNWTAEQVAFARDLVERTEQTLPAKFPDVATLQSLGYENFGVTAPGGWDHWGKPGAWGDEHVLDPEFPETIVTRRLPDGTHRVEAAMFFLKTGTTMDTIPADLRWLPGWHIHTELCVNEQGKFTGIVFSGGTCSNGTPMESPPMMHVWVTDPGCGHRFGGVGVGGLHCDEHATMPMPSGPRPAGPRPAGPDSSAVRATPRYTG